MNNKNGRSGRSDRVESELTNLFHSQLYHTLEGIANGRDDAGENPA